MASKQTPPAGAEYSKEWRTSKAGDCIELVERWSSGGKVVLEVVHNYLDDQPAPEVDTPAEE